MPEEELIDWYYYLVGKSSHYLDDKFVEDNEHLRLIYKFQAPKQLDRAKEVLRKKYPDAFAPTVPKEVMNRNVHAVVHETSS